MIELFLNQNHINYQKNVLLKNKTWIKTGGKVRYWIIPSNKTELVLLVTYLYDNNLSFEVVGHTSNIYYYDSFDVDILISTIKLQHYREELDYIECECGVSVSKISKYLVENGIIGYAGLVNLPGTIGASVYNNSSCFKCSISERLISIDFISPSFGNKIVKIAAEDLKFTHRSSALKRKEIKGVILSVKIKKEFGEIAIEKEKANQATSIRKLTQEPPKLNLGSVYSTLVLRKNFKNFLALRVKGLCIRSHCSNSVYYYINTLLLLYGYLYLKQYISRKNINTFIWKDEKAPFMFEQYQHFMNKVFDNPTLEIELRK